MLTKTRTKLNKNNKYGNQIEYKILTLARATLLGWYVNILKKNLKKSKKFKKTHEVTRGSHSLWSLMI